jgi:CRP/FNR family transcriptional regulator, cyclic AMP receptor protein
VLETPLLKSPQGRFEPKEFLAKIGEGRVISIYGKDQDVFSQGDIADSVFYIQKGKIKLTIVSEHGEETLVAIFGPDEFCGEGCLAAQPKRMASATTLTDCEIMRIEKDAIVRMLHDEPEFSQMFLAHLLARTTGVDDELVDQFFHASEKRLARALLILANFGSEGGPDALIAEGSGETPVKISKQEIAAEIAELRMEAADARELAATFNGGPAVTDLLSYASALEIEAVQLEDASSDDEACELAQDLAMAIDRPRVRRVPHLLERGALRRSLERMAATPTARGSSRASHLSVG